jgi:hypothetical protein
VQETPIPGINCTQPHPNKVLHFLVHWRGSDDLLCSQMTSFQAQPAQGWASLWLLLWLNSLQPCCTPTEQAMAHNQDRLTALRESQARTHVLSKEVRHLQEEKSKQVSTEPSLTLQLLWPTLAAVDAKPGQLPLWRAHPPFPQASLSR